MSNFTYPLDPTGVSVNNLIHGEPHLLAATGLRVITMDYGAFFADSLKLVDATTNVQLAPSQYHAAWRYKVPTMKYKKDLCGLIVITDASVSNKVLVDYQVLGGIYSKPETEVINMLQRRIPNARPSGWGEMLARPAPLTLKDFTDDEFGFPRLENALDSVAATVVNGSVVSQNAVIDYAIAKAAQYNDGTPPSITQALADHISHADDHPYYLKKTDITTALAAAYAPVRKPTNVTPASKATGVASKPTLVCKPYRALYGVPQSAMRYQVSTKTDFSVITQDVTVSSAVNQAQLATALAAQTKYYWRAMFQSIEGEWSAWSASTSFTTA